ncbi:hypothetical protein LEP1GSC016_2878 [Leptospira borgpetersenii serovar Hardjo-bovis str. Sponselee]|uniref:Uncharacterized protein n=5 Tax=Leptospira borgpetersenii TaxID=174 RepID=M3HLY4_LEPBO|nr:hypothetical protein LEP1GSC128_1703 [Leptospira borgpetersenii str. 200801926]EKQ92554.1 hypothetical protein LEP1GSC101_2652 [Leptospira borgpetersenii str. UI 09149]EMF98669.1 hypothetical protein LEP1GSC123_2482 [Leptospira borgpetersenii str. 200701203]EMJ84183.1 hypothetical protein LEP1GSC016_2878 [Leptospira borgpetersenii serovar Hardjo-bovis str. Sponselee]EMK10466.1 hypothetical protein LEP1GSC066_0372 [Leptospira sp. serovar Kenya str. Sh9]EMN13862.1 hypothetical protein LEP1GSC
MTFLPKFWDKFFIFQQLYFFNFKNPLRFFEVLRQTLT